MRNHNFDKIKICTEDRRLACPTDRKKIFDNTTIRKRGDV